MIFERKFCFRIDNLGNMKIHHWLISSLLTATVAAAQTSTNSLPPIPAPAPSVAPAPDTGTSTNAPAKKPVKKKHHKAAAKKTEPKAESKKAEFTEPTVTLAPGTASVVVSNLNVRGQAGLKGEVLAHLHQDESVTVLSEITLDKHKADEPAQWAKIQLPSSADVWVKSSYIDAETKTVKAKKLNLRAGPSEEYSVLGVIEQGTPVNEVGAKGEWVKIEAPTNTFAFVAAIYLKQEASGTLAANPPPSTETQVTPIATTTTALPETQPLVTTVPPNQPAPAPVTTENNPGTTAGTPGAPENNPTTAPVITPAPEVTDTNPPPPRVATHEGYVRASTSLVAPTYYELYDPGTQVTIDYLHSSTTNLNLSRYDGFKIIVTGEEGMVARWNDIPMMTVERIYLVSTNPPIQGRPFKSPRASTSH